MSADNWAVCPRCERKRQQRLADQLKAAGLAYGSVPVDEFDRMRANYDKAAAEQAAATFREDYEFYGAEEGSVVVTYSGCCSTCGLSLEFHHEHPITGWDE